MGEKIMEKFNYKVVSENYKEDALKALRGLVQINSVHDEKTVSPEKPFGNGVSNALTYVANLGKENGFNVDTCDGYATEISFGEGNVDIGIFAHTDVVPVTGNWTHEPFGAEVDDKYIYGRGVADDKGAVIASFYAMKLLKDYDLIKDFKVRLVVGGNEERGSECMRHYFEVLKKPAPTFGFTPDGEFPLIYGEKGITNFEAKRHFDLSPILDAKGGEASNSVIDRFEVTLPNDHRFLKYLDDENIKYEKVVVGTVLKVTFLGKSAHGSEPKLGINAGLLGLKAIANFYKNDNLLELVNFYMDQDGTALGIYQKSEMLGDTTLNIGLMSYKNQILSMTVNFRYPETLDPKKAINHIKMKTRQEITILSEAKVLYFDPNSDMIQTLLKVYQDETGDLESKPLAIGGGTYAKECPNTVAFGCAFKGRPGNIHAPDEYLLLDDFYMQIVIYAHAIIALARLGNKNAD
jgi:succinyl-diaminopimelate desuccinylase